MSTKEERMDNVREILDNMTPEDWDEILRPKKLSREDIERAGSLTFGKCDRCGNETGVRIDYEPSYECKHGCRLYNKIDDKSCDVELINPNLCYDCEMEDYNERRG